MLFGVSDGAINNDNVPKLLARLSKASAASASLPISNHSLAQTYMTASVLSNHSNISLAVSRNFREWRHSHHSTSSRAACGIKVACCNPLILRNICAATASGASTVVPPICLSKHGNKAGVGADAAGALRDMARVWRHAATSSVLSTVVKGAASNAGCSAAWQRHEERRIFQRVGWGPSLPDLRQRKRGV